MINHAVGSIANSANMQALATALIGCGFFAFLQGKIETNWLTSWGACSASSITDFTRDSLLESAFAFSFPFGRVWPETICSFPVSFPRLI